jgi:hypothetical protein
MPLRSACKCDGASVPLAATLFEVRGWTNLGIRALVPTFYTELVGQFSCNDIQLRPRKLELDSDMRNMVNWSIGSVALTRSLITAWQGLQTQPRELEKRAVKRQLALQIVDLKYMFYTI